MEFTKTIGHEKPKKLLLRAIEKGTLFHAYAFVGPENIGKTTFALELAEILGADPILDVCFFDEPQGLLIDQARSLKNRLSLTPVGASKVAIVTGADFMTSQAANSLLKILEEPPARSLLILTTENFYALLPTISSRVQRLNFSPSSAEEVARSFKDLKLSKSQEDEIVSLAKGRIGLARRLTLDGKLLEESRQAKTLCKVLEKGSILERLKASEKLAVRKQGEVLGFLKFAMNEWVENVGELKLARKLQAAFHELNLNLNTKLVLDNLLLP
jgi:DNA polymerase-3 subunit delta'